MRDIYNKLTLGTLNAKPWARAARLLAMAGLAALATAVVQNAPNIDWPGEYDSLIIAGLTGIFGGIDKWARADA